MVLKMASLSLLCNPPPSQVVALAAWLEAAEAEAAGAEAAAAEAAHAAHAAPATGPCELGD